MTHQAARALTLVAGGVVARNRFVTPAANGRFVQSTTSGGYVYGVARDDASEAGKVIPVAPLDDFIIEVEAGAAIVISGGAQKVMSDTTGRAITATTGLFVAGYALDAAGAAGDIIRVLVSRGVPVV